MRPLAADDRGNVLLSLLRGPEDAPPADAPLPLALTALWHGGRVLLVFNRARRWWELPGGLIEPGESPRAAALRELREESGQRPDRPPRFAGWAAFRLGPERRAEYGALFTGHTAAPRPFRPAEESGGELDGEIAALCWWDLSQSLPGYVQPLDACLARLTRAAPR
ncbi:NUDIX hydrolase [Streptomyces carminius]|uniref:NUDIX hydrolase n=1 Tax=Streptomyces carminius TaxID=2665496 RepID=A0A2M8LUY3_9ACTN|nr:NUDIX hydrolase [Streptomyces carminius]PJE95763.1 NUDIX hydrolase [Streptomyces carminius]